MKPITLLAMIVLLVLGSTLGQNEIPTPVAPYCNAQEWYDSVTQFGDIYTDAMNTINRSLTPRQLQERYDAIQESLIEIEEIDYPECAGFAQDSFVKAYTIALEVAEKAYDGELEIIDWAVSFGLSQRAIGESRGFLIAVGVNVIESELEENTQ